VAVLGGMLALAGCYGSTEPATNIAFDHATLNGKGTTNNGPAEVYFEFWETAHPEDVNRSPSVDIPAGVTGPVSRPNFNLPYGLRADTEYTFRLCGEDQASPNGLCAQTRTFRTQRPAGDLVRGAFLTQVGGVGNEGGVHAQSDPDGSNPSGSLRLPGDLGNSFEGPVTCVAVDGHQAAVGAVGTRVDGSPASGLLKVRDDLSAADADELRWVVTPNGGPPDCAGATFDDLSATLLRIFAVYDTSSDPSSN
jgi:hypothetical protein